MDYTLLKDIVTSPAVQICLTLLAILVLQFVSRQAIEHLVRHSVRGRKYISQLDEQKRANTLINVFQTAVAVVLWIVGVIIILSQLHVNLAALMTGAGLVGVIVGFGAQSAISDFLAGMFILAENQYRVGDIVSLTVASKEISGVVEDITIRITRLRDLDGNLHIVRNGLTTTITNLTFNYANVNVDVRVAYESDIDTVERVINEVGLAMSHDEKWDKHIKEPIAFLRVDGFEDSGVRVKALGKVEPAMQWDVAGEFRRRLMKAFEQSGITIALPQIVIHKNS